PDYFTEDFFNVFCKDRPDYRWIIIGPSRSGSTFHKDPNSTSAWNAVITGSKKWIMYPPNILPPGVFTSPDEAEVTAPVSLMEWYANYYEKKQKSNQKPLEGICHA
ncbi:12830_t:CDS:2, partial [Acaulospora morrowiae]